LTAGANADAADTFLAGDTTLAWVTWLTGIVFRALTRVAFYAAIAANFTEIAAVNGRSSAGATRVGQTTGSAAATDVRATAGSAAACGSAGAALFSHAPLNGGLEAGYRRKQVVEGSDDLGRLPADTLHTAGDQQAWAVVGFDEAIVRIEVTGIGLGANGCAIVKATGNQIQVKAFGRGLDVVRQHQGDGLSSGDTTVDLAVDFKLHTPNRYIVAA